MVDQLNYGLRNIDFARLFADTASAKFKSPHTGTFVFEASNAPAHIMCGIRKVWHASQYPCQRFSQPLASEQFSPSVGMMPLLDVWWAFKTF